MLAAAVIWAMAEAIMWARRRVLAENDSGETVVTAPEWFIVTSCQPKAYDSQNSLITAFVIVFEQAMGTPFDQLRELDWELTTLLKKKHLMFPEPLTVINCDASGESWECIAWGHTLSISLYPPDREESEGRLQHSEIDESGAFDRPRKLFFSVHYAGLPFAHSQWGFYQVVVLVPAVDSDDSLQGMAPVLLVAQIAPRDEGNATTEWDA